MAAVETGKTADQVLVELNQLPGAWPLINIFLGNRPDGLLQLVRMQRNLGSSLVVNSDVLVTDAKQSGLQTALALQEFSSGLVLLLVRGRAEALVSHHQDLLTQPPVCGMPFSIYRSPNITHSDCTKCGTGLLAVVESCGSYEKPNNEAGELRYGHTLRMNLFGNGLMAGSLETEWLLGILQQVQSYSTIK